MTKVLLASVKHSPVISVFGQRQSGKTTLLKNIANSTNSFDNPQWVKTVSEQGTAILDSLKKPALLDEAQKYPPIFDLVKLKVDETRRPGQFLLTGSVRFSQKKSIRESLTGRTTLWELLPLTLSEALERPFSNIPKKFSNPKSNLFLSQSYSSKELSHYLKWGGLPGICFIRDSKQRTNAIDSHIATLIERDLDLIASIKISRDLIYRLLRYLVPLQGLPLNLSQLAKPLRLSTHTVKKLLFALEGLFLIRSLGSTIYFDDPAIANHLSPVSYEDPELAFRHLLFCELRAQHVYHRDEIAELTQFSTRGGAWIPFVLELRNSKKIAITFDPLPYASAKSLGSLATFKKKYPNTIAIAVTLSGEAGIKTSGVISVPITHFF